MRWRRIVPAQNDYDDNDDDNEDDDEVDDDDNEDDDGEVYEKALQRQNYY